MIAILYEDQRGERSDFGLHRFICQLVIDRAALTDSVYVVEKKLIIGIPLKGAGNVRKRCRNDLPRFAKTCKQVIAVYDQDQLAKMLKLAKDACRKMLCEKLAENCEPKEILEIILVRDNLESIIQDIRASGLMSSISDQVYDGALGKNQITRDSVFIQCAITDSDTRQKLAERLPDILRIVTRITAVLSKPPG